MRLPRKIKKRLKWRLYVWDYPIWPNKIHIDENLIIWNNRFDINIGW